MTRRRAARKRKMTCRLPMKPDAKRRASSEMPLDPALDLLLKRMEEETDEYRRAFNEGFKLAFGLCIAIFVVWVMVHVGARM